MDKTKFKLIKGDWFKHIIALEADLAEEEKKEHK